MKAFLEMQKVAVAAEEVLVATLSAEMQAPPAVALSTTRVARLIAQAPQVCLNLFSVFYRI